MVIDVPVSNILKKTGLTDRGMATDVLVENDFKENNEKNPVCETLVWPLADRVKNLIEKKWPGLSDSGMASSGLIWTSESLSDNRAQFRTWKGNKFSSLSNTIDRKNLPPPVLILTSDVSGHITV